MALFITIEGPEGSGKTTTCLRLIKNMEEKGINVLYTREPGGSEIAEEIRQIILNKKNTAMDKNTEALLYAAARRQHLVEKVLPALKEGKIVICDRFIDSSLAYQGYARGLGIDEVLNVNLFATKGMLPDLTIYFKIDAFEGLKRINKDINREVNRVDLEKIEFHQKVCEGYEILLKKYPQRIKPIDASLGFDEVYKQLEKLVYKKIEEMEKDG